MLLRFSAPILSAITQIVPLELGPISSKQPGAENAWILRQPRLAINEDWLVKLIENSWWDNPIWHWRGVGFWPIAYFTSERDGICLHSLIRCEIKICMSCLLAIVHNYNLHIITKPVTSIGSRGEIKSHICLFVASAFSVSAIPMTYWEREEGWQTALNVFIYDITIICPPAQYCYIHEIT